MQGEHEVGEHASPEEPWPGMSAGASHAAESAGAGQGNVDDSATWRADQASLQRALDQAIAQPIDPTRRPMWTDTSGGDLCLSPLPGACTLRLVHPYYCHVQ